MTMDRSLRFEVFSMKVRCTFSIFEADDLRNKDTATICEIEIKESFVCVKNRNLKYSEKCGRNNGDDNAPSACH